MSRKTNLLQEEKSKKRKSKSLNKDISKPMHNIFWFNIQYLTLMKIYLSLLILNIINLKVRY